MMADDDNGANRQRYASAALIGLLSNPNTAALPARDLAARAWWFADHLKYQESRPYCAYCGAACDGVHNTKSGIAVLVCADCGSVEDDRNAAEVA
jgi:hypothetical protein